MFTLDPRRHNLNKDAFATFSLRPEFVAILSNQKGTIFFVFSIPRTRNRSIKSSDLNLISCGLYTVTSSPICYEYISLATFQNSISWKKHFSHPLYIYCFSREHKIPPGQRINFKPKLKMWYLNSLQMSHHSSCKYLKIRNEKWKPRNTKCKMKNESYEIRNAHKKMSIPPLQLRASHYLTSKANFCFCDQAPKGFICLVMRFWFKKERKNCSWPSMAPLF